MNTKTAVYTFCNDINEVRKYSSNKNACGALFCSTSTNKVYIMNAINEILEVVNYNSIDTLKEVQSYVEKTGSCNKHPTNCKNCGAVLTSYKCEYCDTEY